MRTYNRKPSLTASLTAAIQRNLMRSAAASDRIMAGRATPADLQALRAGEKCIELLMQKAAS
jgi:hypothetical protein